MNSRQEEVEITIDELVDELLDAEGLPRLRDAREDLRHTVLHRLLMKRGLVGKHRANFTTPIGRSTFLMADVIHENGDRILGLAKNSSETFVLDIACGGCQDHHFWREDLKNFLRNKGFPRAKVRILGLDIRLKELKDMISGRLDYFVGGLIRDSQHFYQRQGETRMRKKYRNRLEVICADAMCLPIATDSIDIVVSSFFFGTHLIGIGEKEFLQREVDRVLKPGGIFFYNY